MTTQSEKSATPYSWYALAVMTAIYSCHFLDRSVISIVVEPVRKEFGLNDSEVGLVTSLLYGVAFAVAGIPVGYLVDRVRRTRMLAIVVGLWSAMTALSGLTHSFFQLLLARMCVGAAEAGGSPTSLSLISDLFPARQRSTAIGFFFLSNAIGGALCIFIGAVIAAQYGWRAAMFVAGGPGLVLALLVLATFREPVRGAMESTARANDPPPVPVGLKTSLREVLARRDLVHLFVAMPFAVAGVAALGAWMPSFGSRFHGMDIKQTSLLLALAVGLFGAIGSLLGGIAGDRLAKHRADRRLFVGVAVCLIAAPVAAAAVLVVDTRWAIGLMDGMMVCGFACIPCGFGAMLILAGPNMRGIVSSAMQIVTNLAGYGLGPFMVGVLSDLFGGENSLRYAMALVMAVCFLMAALHFSLSARAARRLKAAAPTVLPDGAVVPS